MPQVGLPCELSTGKSGVRQTCPSVGEHSLSAHHLGGCWVHIEWLCRLGIRIAGGGRSTVNPTLGHSAFIPVPPSWGLVK